MSSSMDFYYLEKCYDVSLKPATKLVDQAITMNGRAYQILGSEEALTFFQAKIEKIGTTDFANFDSLQMSLKKIDQDGSSKEEKVDSVFQKVVDTSIEKTNSIIIDNNIGTINVSDTINAIGEKLQKHYIFPAVAKKCSEYLQLQFENGMYEKFSELKAFADAITDDLREISEDKHMTFDLLEELSAPQVEESERVIPYSTPNLEEDSFEYKADNFKEFSYEVKSGRLLNDPTVGYLDVRTMGICKTGDGDSDQDKLDGVERKAAFIKAVNNLKGTESIIIDIRNNGGGKPNAVQLLCSLFMEEGEHLDGVESRRGDSYMVDAWDTLPYDDLPLEMRLLKQDITILISPNTFSAAESFANSMRPTKKAVIVGERSGGGANLGGYKKIGSYFDIRIPNARAVNPHLEGNWEGIGIIPDHEVSAKDALDVAISLRK